MFSLFFWNPIQKTCLRIVKFYTFIRLLAIQLSLTSNKTVQKEIQISFWRSQIFFGRRIYSKSEASISFWKFGMINDL